VSQDASTIDAIEAYSLKFLAIDFPNAVVSRKRSVNKRERRVERVQNTAILTNDRGYKKFGFLTHGGQEFLVDSREELHIRLCAVEIA
jgi:hypothetical protein